MSLHGARRRSRSSSSREARAILVHFLYPPWLYEAQSEASIASLPRSRVVVGDLKMLCWYLRRDQSVDIRLRLMQLGFTGAGPCSPLVPSVLRSHLVIDCIRSDQSQYRHDDETAFAWSNRRSRSSSSNVCTRRSPNLRMTGSVCHSRERLLEEIVQPFASL